MKPFVTERHASGGASEARAYQRTVQVQTGSMAGKAAGHRQARDASGQRAPRQPRSERQSGTVRRNDDVPRGHTERLRRDSVPTVRGAPQPTGTRRRRRNGALPGTKAGRSIAMA